VLTACNTTFQNTVSTHHPYPRCTYPSLKTWVESPHGRSSSFVRAGKLGDYCWRGSAGLVVAVPEPCGAADNVGAGTTAADLAAGAVGVAAALLSIIVSWL